MALPPEPGQPSAQTPDSGVSRVYGQLAERAARSSCTILITGETGVGKGHLARWIHERSPRTSSAFVPVNCGAIPETIIDSQLFGHARGAFSGASTDHPGLVRAADHGTLFLDEIGELPPSAQTRLLRLLQEREVQPVGYSRPVTVDVRVLSATNADLRERVDNRHFREDLLFRLDVVRLHVPPLRERREEILTLLRRFNAEFSGLYAQPVLEFDDDALECLEGYAWPGNIRQLRTVVERLHVLCPDDLITPTRLSEIGQIGAATAAARRQRVDSIRDNELERVLEESGGNVARAAAVFGVHRSTIYRWLRSRERSVKS